MVWELNFYHYSFSDLTNNQLNFAVEDKRRVDKLKELDREEALSEAMRIGEALDLQVLDCSSPENKWLG